MTKDELNRLPPALREKKRYLRFEIKSDRKVELGELVDAVWDNCLDYLGTTETSEANFWIIGNKFDEEEQEGIARVRRDKLDDFKAAITLLDQVSGEKAFLRVKEVSGSIKKLEDG